jgi:hypothetical protein
MVNLRHGSYKLLRELKEGLPVDKRTTLGATLAQIELRLQKHFGSFNGPQAVLFSTILLPHLAFLLNHPMINEDGNLMADWKWASSKVENGLRLLTQLAGSEVKKPVSSLEEYLEAKTESQK